MPNRSSRSVSVPVAQLAKIERRCQHLVQQLEEVRLALRALNAEAPDEARSAFLHVIDEQLARIADDAEVELAGLPVELKLQAC
ncbi:hypothetical protein [Microbulbifer thermotolerans]|uniref:hypothetical protein n=1 Tax=Microbulbifer thermotolerans TaxID=252514 RepID=UPI00224A552E|nr:hypothetical protein [Microbulbifer thermotolerans]MCX2834472.1 hypothetical protein [Microbulbifer thermotolerans]